MPDAPEEPGSAMAAEVPGQLSAAAIREVWPEIMTAVSRKSKKIAALAQGATVRDLEGQTVVLTFRFPAHAKMVAAEPMLISDALYEALGGRWQIRCDVAGEGGGSGGSAPRSPRGGPSGPAQRSPQSQDGPPQESPPQDGPPRQEATRTAPTSGGAPAPQREAAPRAAVAERGGPPAPRPEAAVVAESDEWPEPARPGGLATAVATQAPETGPVDDEEWPETALPGGISAGSRPGEAAGQGFAHPGGGQSRSAGNDFTGQAPGGQAPGHAPGDAPGGQAPGGQAVGATTSGAAGSGGGSGGAAYAAGQPGGHAGTGTTVAADGGDPARARPASPDQGTAERGSSRNSAPAAATAPPSAGRAPSSGLAAARAAAAGAGRGTNAAAKTSAWSDGSPTEEAPYDPEYDGPPRANGGGARAYEGFDAGDEPLDDVIDEKTARQSSEQQAVQLLRDALGAEKISES